MSRHLGDSRFRCPVLIAAACVAALALPGPAEAGALIGLAGKCLDVENASTANGTPVNLFTCHGGANQEWEFEAIAPFFRVRGIGDKCLRPSGSGDGRLVIGSCGGTEARWHPDSDFPNNFTLVHATTNQCADVEGASTADGTPVNLFECHGGAHQRWTLAQEVPEATPPGSLVGLGGKCLDVENASTADGTPVNLFTCHGGDNQQWQFAPSGPFFSVSGLGDKCLQPEAGGDRLVIGPCGGLEDRWQPSASFPTSFTLVHVTTGRCMDVENSSTADGTPVNLFACHGGLNQLWTFEEEVEDPSHCFTTSTRMCLTQRRFRVEVDWKDFAGNEGPGRVLFHGFDSGIFWFFTSNNWELLVKVLDGCSINNRFWVFAAATTDVEYTLRVTDTDNGRFREYSNTLGTPAPAVTDTNAFTCP